MAGAYRKGNALSDSVAIYHEIATEPLPPTYRRPWTRVAPKKISSATGARTQARSGNQIRKRAVSEEIMSETAAR